MTALTSILDAARTNAADLHRRLAGQHPAPLNTTTHARILETLADVSRSHNDLLRAVIYSGAFAPDHDGDPEARLIGNSEHDTLALALRIVHQLDRAAAELADAAHVTRTAWLDDPQCRHAPALIAHDLALNQAYVLADGYAEAAQQAAVLGRTGGTCLAGDVPALADATDALVKALQCERDQVVQAILGSSHTIPRASMARRATRADAVIDVAARRYTQVLRLLRHPTPHTPH